MKEIGLEELKKLQLEILLAVHDFCKANEIEYSLAAGTLIGAVRHKGYIPWDDDVDICMTRPNYDKFLRTFNGSHQNYHVLAPELNWDFYAPYANVCDNRTLLVENGLSHRSVEVGVKIDIFPIDGCSDNRFEFFAQCQKLMKLNAIMFYKRCQPKLSFSLLYFKTFLHKVSVAFRYYSSLQKEIHAEATKYDYSKSEFAALMVFEPIAFKPPRQIFDEYIDIEFEGYLLRTIKEYDLFLRLRYGDYLRLPPKELQVPHHGFTAYWKD